MMKRVARTFTKRDMTRFPDDENGDILFGIWKRGGDLDAARTVDFSLIFPTEEQAVAFAKELESRNGEVEVSYFEDKECWDLRFSPTMVPSWKNISDTENWLGAAAARYKGKNDGWGFFSSEP
jgi:hypothetical protein